MLKSWCAQRMVEVNVDPYFALILTVSSLALSVESDPLIFHHAPVNCFTVVERENSSVESILSLQELCRLPQTSSSWGRRQGARDRTHVDGHGDDMKDSNLSQGACVREDEDTTTLPEKMRTMLSGCGCRCTHRAVPREHRCCHWRLYRGVSHKHGRRHWHSRCALSPTQRFFHFVPTFSSCCHVVAIHQNFYL